MFMSKSLLGVVFSLLFHPQQTVREHAIKAYVSQVRIQRESISFSQYRNDDEDAGPVPSSCLSAFCIFFYFITMCRAFMMTCGKMHVH